jgi:xylulokinase
VILAYDIGTTHLKAAVVDGSGTVIAASRVPIHAVENEDPRASEVLPDCWLSGIALATAQLRLHDRGRLSGVVVSAAGPSLLAVDEDGEALGPALTWMDRRSDGEAAEIAEFATSAVDASFYLPKALWLRRNRPDHYERCRWLLGCGEFIELFLTGSARRVIPTALFADFFWNEPVIPLVGLDPARFPPFVEPGEPLGVVREQAADALGIPAGLPVLAGGPDFLMSILGTAATQPGRTCDRIGTSEGVNLCSPRPIHDRRLLCFPHVVRGAYNVSAMLSSSGGSLAWASRALAGFDGDVDALLAAALEAEPGAGRLLFLPFLWPERFPIWDPGLGGAFVGLSHVHGPRQMARAVVESSGFAVRAAIEVMESLGAPVGDLRVTGGLARSAAWCQIRADVTGRRVLAPEQEEADLVGNACVGFYGLEQYDSLAEASESMVRFKPPVAPSEERRRLYDGMYETFRAACLALSGLSG